jgi:hypothetical protein
MNDWQSQFECVQVTPEMADAWLEKQPRNRPIKDMAVKHYREEYESGRWIASPAMPLIFDTNGRLRDGQHRLMALALFGRPVKMFVRRNVTENELFAIHDTVSRSLGDTIAISREVGINYGRYIASIGSMILMRQRVGYISLNMSAGRHRLSVHQIDEAFGSINRDPADVVSRALAIHGIPPRGLALFTVTEIGYAIAQSPAGIEDWLMRLVSDNGQKTSSMLAARTYKANPATHARARNAGHAAIAKAWNMPNITKIQMGRKTESSTPAVPDLVGGCFDKEAP